MLRQLQYHQHRDQPGGMVGCAGRQGQEHWVIVAHCACRLPAPGMSLRPKRLVNWRVVADLRACTVHAVKRRRKTNQDSLLAVTVAMVGNTT